MGNTHSVLSRWAGDWRDARRFPSWGVGGGDAGAVTTCRRTGRCKLRERWTRVTALPGEPIPDDVVAVAAVELLPMLPRAVHHADPRHEVHDLLGRRVVEVVAALVAPVAVHPLEPQVAARGAPGRHVGAPTRRCGSGPAGAAGSRATKALPPAARTLPLKPSPAGACRWGGRRRRLSPRAGGKGSLHRACC